MSVGDIESGVRLPRQRRSEGTRRKIVDAAIDTLADKGVAGLTHRAVAARAGVSLAATTYYYATRFDIIADASRHLLAGYLDDFRRFAEREPANPTPFPAFAVLLLRRAASRERKGVVAWCEIMLNAARHAELTPVAGQWYCHLAEAWRAIAVALDDKRAAADVQPTIDTICGLIFMIVALGLSENQVAAVLADNGNPLVEWKGDAPVAPASPVKSGKAARTRETILAAGIQLLIADGPGSLTHHAVAAQAGVSIGTPAYHFHSIGTLIGEAQVRLFQAAKLRYRDAVAGINMTTLDRRQLVDLTTTIFVREATEFARYNLASHSIWIEAARRPELRAMIRESIADQYLAWTGILTPLANDARPVDAMLVQAFFLGKLIRMLSTGAPTSSLAQTRGEFDRELGAILDGDPWL